MGSERLTPRQAYDAMIAFIERYDGYDYAGSLSDWLVQFCYSDVDDSGKPTMLEPGAWNEWLAVVGEVLKRGDAPT